MKPSVYLETTIISYIAANASNDVRVLGNQQLTLEWWENRHIFDLYISEFVIAESSLGDAVAAARRLKLIENIPELETKEESRKLARYFWRREQCQHDRKWMRTTLPLHLQTAWSTC